jgi:hypothetical protein
MQTRPAFIALALFGLTASPYAQNRVPPSPAAILIREREELKLSSAQVKKLQELDRKFTHDTRPVQERMMKNRAAERRLRAKEKELTPAERQEMSRDRAAIHKDTEELASMRRANRAEVLKVLTPAQRTKAEALMKERAEQRRAPASGKKPAHRPTGRPSGSLLQLLPH